MKIGLIAALIALALGKGADYSYDESITRNKCKNELQCDGLRKCSAYGWCQGVSRPSTKTSSYTFD